jgi:hypothetical protein
VAIAGLSVNLIVLPWAVLLVFASDLIDFDFLMKIPYCSREVVG